MAMEAKMLFVLRLFSILCAHDGAMPTARLMFEMEKVGWRGLGPTLYDFEEVLRGVSGISVEYDETCVHGDRRITRIAIGDRA